MSTAQRPHQAFVPCRGQTRSLKMVPITALVKCADKTLVIQSHRSQKEICQSSLCSFGRFCCCLRPFFSSSGNASPTPTTFCCVGVQDSFSCRSKQLLGAQTKVCHARQDLFSWRQP